MEYFSLDLLLLFFDSFVRLFVCSFVCLFLGVVACS